MSHGVLVSFVTVMQNGDCHLVRVSIICTVLQCAIVFSIKCLVFVLSGNVR